MRWLEVALLFAPIAAFVLWWTLSRRGGPSPRLVVATAAGLCLLLASLIWIAEAGSLGRGETYVPATWRNGSLIPGHGAP